MFSGCEVFAHYVHVHVAAQAGRQAAPSKRVREEVPRLRNRRYTWASGKKAMELMQPHSLHSSSPACTIHLGCFNKSDHCDSTSGEHALHRCWLTTNCRRLLSLRLLSLLPVGVWTLPFFLHHKHMPIATQQGMSHQQLRNRERDRASHRCVGSYIFNHKFPHYILIPPSTHRLLHYSYMCACAASTLTWPAQYLPLHSSLRLAPTCLRHLPSTEESPLTMLVWGSPQ